jgi:hypothetical protein
LIKHNKKTPNSTSKEICRLSSRSIRTSKKLNKRTSNQKLLVMFKVNFHNTLSTEKEPQRLKEKIL